jgi:CRISPR-associated endonuclease/helicase Cas3
MARLLLTDEARQIPAAYGSDFGDAGKSLSWWFAGLAVLADWLGSNTAFFKYKTEPGSLDEYWKSVRHVARQVLDETGVLPTPVAPGKTLHDFFPHIQEASPLQGWAQSVPLAHGPQIFLLEDVTGAGKTEAAMMLAYRLMAHGSATGFFVGLPTMATANAMYERVARFYQQLFDGDASLALGHGFKDLVKSFAESVLPKSENEHDPAQPDETASARCTAWLADHNKRVLLAPAGVGTVDQALLAVLHSKHQSLRLLGLFNKVLIVDEVHACDTYMEGVLKILLGFHASMGSSVILLSATLPARMKRALLNAYAGGCDARILQPLDDAYPLATRWSADENVLHQDHLASRPNVSRTVQVRYLCDEEQLYADIRNCLVEGQCVGWIRNTVGDAVDAFERLALVVEPGKSHLFHARFALGDRLDTEQDILDQFGDHSSAAIRSGRLMIATQVAEQSLDVDFDVLVSDLAPIDRMLQRAGRVHRHVRDSSGNRLRQNGAVDGRPVPVMWVLAPAWVDVPDAAWYAAKFKTGQYVYPRHDQLWLTAGALQEGCFTMPGDARRMIETVYSDGQDMPAAREERASKAGGDSSSHASIAQMNTLKFVDGYKRGDVGDWWEDTQTPSRLGEATVEVMLARWEDGRLRQWHDGAWAYSMVKIAAWRIGSPEITADRQVAYEGLRETLPSKGKYCVLLPLERCGDGTWQARAWTLEDTKLGRPARLLTWLYDAALGLRVGASDAEEAASD